MQMQILMGQHMLKNAKGLSALDFARGYGKAASAAMLDIAFTAAPAR
jgi:hypothetical protein